MVTRIRNFLTPPNFEDEEKARVGRLLHIILLLLLGASIMAIPALFSLEGPEILLSSDMAAIVTTALVSVALLFVSQRGKVYFASLAVSTGLFIVIAANPLLGDGSLLDPITSAGFALVIATAGALLGGWAVIAFTALSVAASFGIYYKETVSSIPASVPLSVWILYALTLVALGLIIRFAVNSLRDALKKLDTSNQELEKFGRSLEVRVAERTRDLALAAEVGHRITSIRDLDKLLAEAVELIQSSFDLYYVQAYLADAAGRSLTLKAGTGAIGDELVRRGHRLPIGLGSINGTAASDQRPVIVSDTTHSPIFRPNPLLPNTRSEMAVPLIAGDRVVGVLNLQNDAPDTLSTETLPVFETLAGQLAVAIENARLFAQVTQTQANLEAQAARLARSHWEEYLDNRDDARLDITYSMKDTIPATQETEETPYETATYTAPINIVGEEIGRIQIERFPDRPWTENDSHLVEAVASQVAQQLENLRLLDEAERYRGEAEAAVRRLTREAWNSYLDEERIEKGYIYDGLQINPLDDETESLQSTLSSDLTVQGQPIGELFVEETEFALDEDAVDLAEAVAERLSIHIENLRLNQQTEQALAEAESLYQISSRLNAATTLEEVIQATVGPGPRAETATISLLKIETDQYGQPTWLELVANEPESNIPLGSRFYLPEFPLSKLYLLNPEQAVLIGNVSQDGRVDPTSRALLEQSQLQSLVVLPLRVGPRWIGLITLGWPQPYAFTDTEQRLYDSIATQAAAVVDAQLLFKQTQDALAETEIQAQRLAMLNEMAAELGTADTRDKLFNIVIQKVNSLLNTQRVSLALPNKEGEKLVLYALDGENNVIPTGTQLPMQNTSIGTTFLKRQLVITDDTKSSEFMDVQKLAEQDFQSTISAPLIAQRGVMGTLNVASTAPHAFDSNAQNLIMQIASLLSAAMENRQLLSEAQRQAQNERLVNEITQKIQSTATMESALQTTIRELGRALQVRATRITLTPTTDGNGREQHHANHLAD